MYSVLLVIHVIASVFLIAVILLQAGRGGGLADTFGGPQMQSLFGTKSANILTRLTTICAALFIITCLTLAIISSKTSRSLIDKVAIPEAREEVEVEVGDVEEEVPVTEEGQPPVEKEEASTQIRVGTPETTEEIPEETQEAVDIIQGGTDETEPE